MNDLRRELVDIALRWEQAFGNAPAITSALSEYDAAHLVGCSLDAYSQGMQGATSVQRGHDFRFNDATYQVKANRPSGKKGSVVTLVPRANNFEWDRLIWILYSARYEIQEAWLWSVHDYRHAFEHAKRLSPKDMRLGHSLTTEYA
jgi:hypothetical protein